MARKNNNGLYCGEKEMSAYSRNTLATKFNDIYQTMNDTKKDLFAKLCDKLLGYNFVYGQLPEDKNDYYYILEMREAIESYFVIIEFQLVHDDTRKIFYLESTADRNRVRLKKMETVILVLLRRFYYTKSKETIDSNTNISITIDELISALDDTGIYKNKEKVPKTLIIESLSNLKKFKLLNFDKKNYETNNVIEIFPTVSLVVKINDIDLINHKLKTYIAREEDEDNETDED